MNRHVPRRHRDRSARGTRARALGAALLIDAILATALAGCGGGGGGSSTVASPTRTTSTSSSTTSRATTTATTSRPATSGVGGTERVGAAKPQAAAATILTSNDLGKVCGTYVTQHYLRAAFGGRQGCVQAQRPGAVAQSVGLSRAVGSSGTATLTAKPTGGPYDGEKVKVTLVKQNGAWKVDSLHANVPVGP